MKTASLDNGTPDGQMVIVSDDFCTCVTASSPTVRAYLDGIHSHSDAGVEPLNTSRFLAPLPRATQFLDGSAYVNHVDLVRRARGAAMPDSFWTDPLMYQGCSTFMAPTSDITGDPAWGIDFEAEIAVITTDVPQGIASQDATASIAFIMLINDVSLRGLIPAELSKGFGFVQSKPPSACSPYAVSPDDCLGWNGRKLTGTLYADLNGEPFGRADAGKDMTFDFCDLIAHAAKTRPLPAGTVIGSGTISNRDGNGGPGRPVADGGQGYSCIAEQRMVETINSGQSRTPFLQNGDTVKIWMEDNEGRSIFGDINQKVRTQ